MKLNSLTAVAACHTAACLWWFISEQDYGTTHAKHTSYSTRVTQSCVTDDSFIKLSVECASERIFGKDIDKSLVARFCGSQCIATTWHLCKVFTVNKWFSITSELNYYPFAWALWLWTAPSQAEESDCFNRLDQKNECTRLNSWGLCTGLVSGVLVSDGLLSDLSTLFQHCGLRNMFLAIYLPLTRALCRFVFFLSISITCLWMLSKTRDSCTSCSAGQCVCL